MLCPRLVMLETCSSFSFCVKVNTERKRLSTKMLHLNWSEVSGRTEGWGTGGRMGKGMRRAFNKVGVNGEAREC